MISFSWMERRWSICAMRALIIISASLATVMEPSRTWATNSFTRSFPRSRAVVSAPNRPCSTIWSSNPFSGIVTTAASDGWAGARSAIGLSFFCSHFTFQLVELLGGAGRVKQQFFELVVALKRAPQVREPGAQGKQLFERLYLLGYIPRLKILHRLEMQIHFQLGCV